MVARWAHNPKAVGSTPTSATIPAPLPGGGPRERFCRNCDHRMGELRHLQYAGVTGARLDSSVGMSAGLKSQRPLVRVQV